jgi:hypothetical protein
MSNEFDNIFISGPPNWNQILELRKKVHFKKEIPLLKS